MKRILCISICAFSFFIGFSQGFLKVEGQQIIDGQGKNVLLRGMGLGGYMLQEGYMLRVPFSGQQYVFKEHVAELIGEEKTEEFYAKWHHNFMQKQDVDSLAKWGFNSIRLPMHYNLFTLPVDQEPVKGKHTWIKKGFTMVDQLISWCKDNNMYLILDMHATPGGQGHDVNISDRDPNKPSLWESKENQDKLVALWVELAKRYKNEPVIGAYDIINEPNWSFEKGINKNGIEDSKNVPLKEVMVKITKAIREVDKNHIIIIEGNGWGNNYNGVLPPWDNNMVLSFHKYWNDNNQEAIQKFLDYRKTYNLPIWLGESGENSNTWFTDAITLMEKNNIGWCWWPLKKLGHNNPLQIKTNQGYQDILNYWDDKGAKPTEAAATEALMQLAENTKIANCIVHKDVIDAMIRQPHSEDAIPFKAITIDGKGSIKAVDYDMGRKGIAYDDLVYGNYYISTGGKRQAGNVGYTYRNDGVDIFKDNNQYYIGETEKNDWVGYTFKVTQTGKYQLNFVVASEEDRASAGVSLDKKDLGVLAIKNTSGKWKSLPLTKVSLAEGEHKIVFKINEGGFNFEAIELEYKP